MLSDPPTTAPEDSPRLTALCRHATQDVGRLELCGAGKPTMLGMQDEQPLPPAFSEENDGDRPEHDPHILRQPPSRDVFQIVLDLPADVIDT